MTDFTNVNTQSLMNFGTKTGESSSTFADSMATPVNNTAAAMEMGTSGFGSARYVATRQSTVLAQMAAYYADVINGTTSLMKGSMAMGVNYLNADVDAKDEMNTVSGLFNPPAAPPSQEEGQRPEVPTTPSTELPPAEVPVDENNPCEVSPEDQVDNYENDVNEDGDDDYVPPNAAGQDDDGSQDMAPGAPDGTYGGDTGTPEPVTV